ncbi:MAG: hypothetical protein VKS61_15570 [Candidatus Sericytochromatia bacterium]|nr:hypothetical protein [Candidatus Sericytochromatia bacterium]
MLDRWIARRRVPPSQFTQAPAGPGTIVSEATGRIAVVAEGPAWAARVGAALDASHPRCERLVALTPEEWGDLAATTGSLEVVVVVPPADPNRVTRLWETLAALRPMPAFVVLALTEATPRLPSGLRPVTWLQGPDEAVAGAVADALERVTRARAEAARDLRDLLDDPSPMPHRASRPLVELLRARTLSPAEECRCAEALEAMVDSLPLVTRQEALELLATRAAELLDEFGFTHGLARLDALTSGAASQTAHWVKLREELAPRLHAAIDRQLEHARLQRRLGHHAGVIAVCDAVDGQLANILPAGFLRADAQRHLGHLAEATETYMRLADVLAIAGETAHATRVLRHAGSLDVEGVAESRIAAKLEAVAEAEAVTSGQASACRWPTMWICGRAMCREVAEESGGLWRHDASEACDVCDWGVVGRTEALLGLTVGIVGGGLGRPYREALLRLGAREVRHHHGVEAPEAVPGVLEGADAVVLVGGAAIHAGLLRAERLLLTTPRPTARVRFHGVRQVVRAVALELAPRLS